MTKGWLHELKHLKQMNAPATFVTLTRAPARWPNEARAPPDPSFATSSHFTIGSLVITIVSGANSCCKISSHHNSDSKSSDFCRATGVNASGIGEPSCVLCRLKLVSVAAWDMGVHRMCLP